MDQILINLQDPSWWFTGVFFVLVGILITKIVFTWLPKLWRYISKLIPKATLRITRWKEKTILLRVKRYRQHQIKVNWLIARYWAMAILATMYMGFLAVSYSLSNESHENSKEITKLLPLVLPAYFLQILVMWERSILKRVINEHIKWDKRIINRSSKDALTRAAELDVRPPKAQRKTEWQPPVIF